nr:DUF389 domain-containing protein [uncultured Ruminococcus sp.]
MVSKAEKMKTIFKNMFSLKADVASHEEIREHLLQGGKITGTNMCVLICAMVIASVGLNVSSTAVIIGAMLISPLMGSILAMAYGLVTNDLKLWRNHAVGFGMQIVISLVTSTLYFLLSPLKEATPELLARTSPTFFDVLIATAGGIAGIIGQTRQGQYNSIIPGVAIATALMPPICTCGYSIANANWKMLGGAAYLFIVNAYFIFLASAVILVVLKTPKVRQLTEKEWKKLRFKMIRNTLIILIPSIILAYFMIKGK